MSHRYRFIGAETAPGLWLLDADEALHLAKVLRLSVGTAVEVTDGAGAWALGTVAAVAGKSATIAGETTQVEAPPAWRLQVCVGALRPGLLDEILPGLTELGVDAIHVFQQQDNAKARLADKAVERWQRIIVQAIKQCKRARLPSLQVHGSVRELVAALAADTAQRVLLDPVAGESLWGVLGAGVAPAGLLLALGGEKGFSADEEASLRQAGFRPAALGRYVLRAITAALSASSIAAAAREAAAR